jgi:hypothetical protein
MPKLSIACLQLSTWMAMEKSLTKTSNYPLAVNFSQLKAFTSARIKSKSSELLLAANRIASSPSRVDKTIARCIRRCITTTLSRFTHLFSNRLEHSGPNLFILSKNLQTKMIKVRFCLSRSFMPCISSRQSFHQIRKKSY